MKRTLDNHLESEKGGEDGSLHTFPFGKSPRTKSDFRDELFLRSQLEVERHHSPNPEELPVKDGRCKFPLQQRLDSCSIENFVVTSHNDGLLYCAIGIDECLQPDGSLDPRATRRIGIDWIHPVIRNRLLIYRNKILLIDGHVRIDGGVSGYGRHPIRPDRRPGSGSFQLLCTKDRTEKTSERGKYEESIF